MKLIFLISIVFLLGLSCSNTKDTSQPLISNQFESDSIISITSFSSQIDKLTNSIDSIQQHCSYDFGDVFDVKIYYSGKKLIRLDYQYISTENSEGNEFYNYYFDDENNIYVYKYLLFNDTVYNFWTNGIEKYFILQNGVVTYKGNQDLYSTKVHQSELAFKLNSFLNLFVDKVNFNKIFRTETPINLTSLKAIDIMSHNDLKSTIIGNLPKYESDSITYLESNYSIDHKRILHKIKYKNTVGWIDADLSSIDLKVSE